MGADVLIAMLPDRPDDAIHAIKEGSIFINGSTIEPAFTRQIRATLAERGVEMIDSPGKTADRAIAGTSMLILGAESVRVHGKVRLPARVQGENAHASIGRDQMEHQVVLSSLTRRGNQEAYVDVQPLDIDRNSQGLCIHQIGRLDEGVACERMAVADSEPKRLIRSFLMNDVLAVTPSPGAGRPIASDPVSSTGQSSWEPFRRHREHSRRANDFPK